MRHGRSSRASSHEGSLPTSTPHPPLTSYLAMNKLDEDILCSIVSYLPPETLKNVKAAHSVFFKAWMKTRYESLTLTKNDKRLLDRLR